MLRRQISKGSLCQRFCLETRSCSQTANEACVYYNPHSGAKGQSPQNGEIRSEKRKLRRELTA